MKNKPMKSPYLVPQGHVILGAIKDFLLCDIEEQKKEGLVPTIEETIRKIDVIIDAQSIAKDIN